MDWQILFFSTRGKVGRVGFLVAILCYTCVALIAWFSAVVLLTSDTLLAIANSNKS